MLLLDCCVNWFASCRRGLFCLVHLLTKVQWDFPNLVFPFLVEPFTSPLWSKTMKLGRAILRPESRWALSWQRKQHLEMPDRAEVLGAVVLLLPLPGLLTWADSKEIFQFRIEEGWWTEGLPSTPDYRTPSLPPSLPWESHLRCSFWATQVPCDHLSSPRSLSRKAWAGLPTSTLVTTITIIPDRPYLLGDFTFS